MTRRIEAGPQDEGPQEAVEEEEEEKRTPLSFLHESGAHEVKKKEEEGKTMDKKGRCAHFHNPPNELGHSIHDNNTAPYIIKVCVCTSAVISCICFLGFVLMQLKKLQAAKNSTGLDCQVPMRRSASSSSVVYCLHTMSCTGEICLHFVCVLFLFPRI